MDHSEALKLRAAERYALGDLPVDVRDAYEEHFFDCADCAMDIRAMSTFAHEAREIFREEEKAFRGQKALESVAAPQGDTRHWWSGLLRPLVVVPAFAALLMIVSYQNLRTIPQLAARSGASVQVLNTFSLAAANSRGAAEVRVVVHRGEDFALDFDIPPGKGFAHYLCQLQDASGKMLRQVSITAEQANKSVELFIPAGMMRPGAYSVVVAGDQNQAGQFLAQDEVARLSFDVVIEN